MKFWAFVVAVAGCSSAAFAAIDSSCYIRNGLVIQYDGRDNAGFGKHDPAATVWKNLAQSGRDATLSGRTEWSDDNLSVFAYDTADNGLVTLDGILSATHTLEFRVRVSRTKGNGILFGNNSRPYYGLKDAAATRSRFFYCTYGKTSETTMGDYVDFTGVGTYSLTHTGVKEGPAVYYTNGVISASLTTVGTTIGLFTMYLGNLKSAGGNGIDAEYSSFRVYKRTLSAEELAVNAAIDRIRFEGADPASIDWPDGFRWNDGHLEAYVKLSAPSAKGLFSVRGGEPTDSFEGWIAADEAVAVTPAEGYVFAGWQDATGIRHLLGPNGALPFGGGELTACFDTLPITDGLVLHLDAQQKDTLVRDVIDYVNCWNDLGANPYGVNCAQTNSWHETHPRGTPHYDKFAFDGRGGVRFGWFRGDMEFPGGVYTQQCLRTKQVVSVIKTVFVAVRTDPGANAGNCQKFNDWRGYVLSRSYSSGYDASICMSSSGRWQAEPSKAEYDNTGWQNGVRLVDRAAGYYSPLVGTTSSTRIFPYQMPGATQLLGYSNNQTKIVDSYHGLWFEGSALTLGRCAADFSTWKDRMLAGWIGEIVCYNRVLSTDEFLRVQNHLMRKWGVTVDAQENYVFTGAAGTDDWMTGGNWDGGKVPDNPTAEISIGSHAVSVSGDLGAWSRFHSEPGAKLSLLDGARFDTQQGTTMLPAATVLEGKVTKGGPGTLQFEKAEADFSTGSLHLVNGFLDLAGGSYAFANLTSSGGSVINSSDARATLAIATSEGEVSELGAPVFDDVDIVKRGGGELKVTASEKNLGATKLSEGLTSVLCPTGSLPVIRGLGMHIDASRVETLSTNADGTVWAWQDVFNADNRFTTNAANARADVDFALPYTMPTYDPGAFGGRGGVRFGWCTNNPQFPDGVYTQQFLSSTKSFPKNLTIFVVCCKDPDATAANHCPGRSSNTDKDYVLSSVITSGYDSSLCCGTWYDAWVMNSPSGHGLEHIAFWYNGKCYIDRPNGFMAEGVQTANSGKDYYHTTTGTKGVTQLLVFRSAQTKSIDGYTHLYWGGDTLRIGNCGANFGTGSGFWGKRMLAGWIGEELTYDHALTDEEVRAVERHLIAKWGITHALVEPEPANNRLSPDAKLELAQGATLDLDGTTQTVARVTAAGPATVTNGTLVVTQSLETVVGADSAFATLTLDCDLDVTDVDFVLSGAKPRRGTVLQTKGTVTGPFKTVDAPDPTEVRYRTSQIIYGLNGLLLFVR